ncbi:carboxylate-amine ligase [Hyphomicrobium sp. D-2]|uniref:carboxylate-amine ligase n=1 Tax=Hyphomicrobium sp. D-2 TaxID=3041621 RepID=UPI0024577B19|nr:carboxylate-amine ligase [Hyphomicrobium sp. D-2]MDH4981479.1 carboxylate-amine ligase [Hyphomicrobium sp. D-2]
MGTMAPSFTFGIEEEYHLVDLESRHFAPAPEELMRISEAELGKQVAPEFFRSQIEVGTSVHNDFAAARKELARLRGTIARIAARFGMAPIAASTHPFADRSGLETTPKPRYQALAEDFGGIGRRLAICGMHVHVAIDDPDMRIDLMNQVRYFLPHFLMLSTSSPFWQGEDTGLKSYRLAVFHELPRTGLPQRFESFTEYERTIDVLLRNGVIEDATKIWWDLRPSARFPTLEMRVTDVCTRLDDALSIAALYACTLRMLYRLRRANQKWRSYPAFLIEENRWRAQRYGVSETLFDFGQGKLVPFATLITELVGLLAEDAAALGCEREVRHALNIATGGTSADRQVTRYRHLQSLGATQAEALVGVVDGLIAETVEGCDV